MAKDWADAQAILDAVRDFELSHSDVRVELQGVQFEHLIETVKAGVARGDPPDVAQWHAFAAGAQGVAEAIEDVWQQRLKDSDFLPGSIEDVTWAGRRYGVPLDTNAMLLIYNKPALSKAGVRLPLRTFGDLERAARSLTSKDGSRRAIGLPSATWNTYGWIRANGGEVVSIGADGKPVFTFDAAPVVEAVGFLGRLVTLQVAFGPAGLTGDRTDAFVLLRDGSAAMHASGSWDLATLEREGLAKDYGVAVMPGGTTGRTAGSTMGGSSMFVPKGSRNRALAIDFMLHITSVKYSLRHMKEEGRLPVRLSDFEDPFFNTSELQTFLVQLKSAHPFKLESFPEAHAAFREAVVDVLQGRKDAATALREAQRRAERTVP